MSLLLIVNSLVSAPSANPPVIVSWLYGKYIRVLGSFCGNVFLANWPYAEGLEEFLIPLAHNFVAHLSGWLRLRGRAMPRACFSPE